MAHSVCDDISRVVTDFTNHTPDERQHILKGCFEGAAGMAALITGNDALGKKLLNASVDDMFTQGHLDFSEVDDVLHTINHLRTI